MTLSTVERDNEFLPSVLKEVIFDEQTVMRRIEQLACSISEDYEGSEVIAVGILTEAFMFTGDLVRRLKIPASMDFMAVSQYDKDLPNAEVELIQDIQEDIEGKSVLLIEGIVDTGLTLNYLTSILANRGPASLKICTFLDRPDLRLVDIPIEYLGFQVTEEFLVGYGLDYKGNYGNLPFVATMNL